jgi:FixJ family two-component response regulator
MNRTQATVFVVDDSPGIRIALTCRLEVAGYQVRAFESAEQFLKEQNAEAPGCLLLDVRMPGMSGIDLQRALVVSARPRPIIFLTGHGDIETSVQAMKMGAVDFLTKPIDDTRFFSAVDQAIGLDLAERLERTISETIQRRLQVLTRRERRVMELVIRGRINKQIAVELEIQEKTVKVHRGRVMKKMGVRSVATLVRHVARAGIQPKWSEMASLLQTKRIRQVYPFDVRRRNMRAEARGTDSARSSEGSRSRAQGRGNPETDQNVIQMLHQDSRMRQTLFRSGAWDDGAMPPNNVPNADLRAH